MGTRQNSCQQKVNSVHYFFYLKTDQKARNRSKNKKIVMDRTVNETYIKSLTENTPKDELVRAATILLQRQDKTSYQLGKVLHLLKKKKNHKETGKTWKQYVKETFDISHRTAVNYIRLYLLSDIINTLENFEKYRYKKLECVAHAKKIPLKHEQLGSKKRIEKLTEEEIIDIWRMANALSIIQEAESMEIFFPEEEGQHTLASFDPGELPFTITHEEVAEAVNLISKEKSTAEEMEGKALEILCKVGFWRNELGKSTACREDDLAREEKEKETCKAATITRASQETETSRDEQCGQCGRG
jgi:hypothetical protein